MVAAAHQNLNIEVHSSCVFMWFSTIVSAVMCAAWNLNVVHCLMKLDAKLRDRQRNKCANQYMHMLSKYDRYIATVRHNNWSKLLSFILIWSTHKKKNVTWCYLMWCIRIGMRINIHTDTNALHTRTGIWKWFSVMGSDTVVWVSPITIRRIQQKYCSLCWARSQRMK